MVFLISQFIILVGLAIFAYFSWRKIDYGIMAIVFCLPLYLVKLNIFGIPSTALELGVYILFIVWLAKNYRDVFCMHTPSNSPYKGENKKEPPPLFPYSGSRLQINYKRSGIGEVGWGIIQQRLNLIKKEKTLIIGILLLLAGATISTFFSSDIRTSAGILKGWFFDPLLFFIVLASAIKNSDQVKNILKIFSLSGLAVAAISLSYWFGFFPNGVSYDGRLHGIYSSPNYLAMYLAPALIIAVWVFLKPHKVSFSVIPSEARNPLNIKNSEVKRFLPACWRVEMTKYLHFLFQSDKIVWFVFIMIVSIAIYLTYSYAAWVVLVFSLSFMACFLLKEISLKKKIFLLSTFYFLLSTLLFAQIGTSKFDNLKNLAYRSSANSRLMIWRSALAIGRDNLIFGIGPGNFQKYYLDYQQRFTEPYLEWAVPQPHNIFLAFWLETGILGLAGFILILFWFFKSGILISKEPRPSGIRNIAIILFSVMVYILLHGLVDTTYWKNDLAMIFWLILGLMLAIKKTAE